MKAGFARAHIFSRRGFMQALTAAALSRAGYSAEPERAGSPIWNLGRTPSVDLERHYRADAQVLFLGMQLLRREGVGGGSVVWREYGDAGSSRLLEFSGFSSPERAAGLNRVGFIREMARGSDRGVECLYFGVMTASPEESAEDARKALHSNAKEQTYSVIDGRIGGGEIETASTHFTAPAGMSGERQAELLDRARQALASVGRTASSEIPYDNSRSFLQTLAELLMRPDGEQGRYIYSGRAYVLRLTRSADPKAAVYFQERGLIAGSTTVLRVSGRVRRELGGKETDFRLWVPAAGRPVPLRIEYQPKSYLRLTFEAKTD
jgi:hypothetical protein